MKIELSKQLCEIIGYQKLKIFGVDEERVRWNVHSIDLRGFTKARSKQLRDLLSKFDKQKKVSQMIRDIDTWLSALEDPDTVKVRKLKSFDSLLKEYMKDKPKHWLYEKDEVSNTWRAYLVNGIAYHEAKREGGYYQPAYVSLDLLYDELGRRRETDESFRCENIEGMTVAEGLMRKGFSVETPEILAEYTACMKKYNDIYNKVGLQFHATGQGTTDVDGNYSYHTKSIIMDKDGASSNVVIDIFNERDENNREKQAEIDESFWKIAPGDFEGSESDVDDVIEPEDVDSEEPIQVQEVPLCHKVVIFDLKRHIRMRIHVAQLTEYVYDNAMSLKLVLPKETTDLVNMLVSHKPGFKDIIGNKGGGAIILCAGKPGTGKTLTAEVYSEAMSRPLYSVQCSQLGITPEDLEKELLLVFNRAARWNAILLLDEADVYVAARGSNLVQNAIVGVFLRVLEYYQGVLFLTTNRDDLVDDAVASRCLAKITYQPPTPENQARIWRVLAETAGIFIKDGEIALIVKEFPKLSGRDVKNLLKLASMVAINKGDLVGDSKQPHVNSELVKFVKQFKPTNDTFNEQVKF